MFKIKKDFKDVKKMRSFFIIGVLFVVLSFYALYAMRYTPDVAYAGISGTKHDLSVSGPGPIKAASATEKCVFCHTPHSGTTGVYPLWNRALSSANYTVLGAPPPFSARLTTPGQPDMGSKLCLSCHDGTVSIGAVRNSPGRGSTGTIALADGITTMPTNTTGYLGTDLTAKHMVSIEYDSGLVTAKLAKCSTGEASMALTSLPLPPTDPVKLWPTNHTNAYAPATYQGVQCRSCHDPHESSTKCFLVPVTGISCSSCPCNGPGDNYDALCDKCHYPCP